MSANFRSSRDLLALTVLAFLSEEPHHAYDMERLIRYRHKDFAAGKPRGLYHAVERLHALGSIQPIEHTREGRRPERTVYRITEEGREQFQAWLSELLEVPQPEHPFLTVAISFLPYLPPSKAAEDLRGRLVHLEAEIAGIEAALRTLRDEMRLPRLVLLEHEARRALRQTERDWVRSIIDQIERGQLSWPSEHWDDLFAEHTSVPLTQQELA